MPASVERRAGAFTLSASTVIVTDAATQKLGRQLASMLAPATGWDLAVRSGASPNGPHVALRLDPAQKSLGAEGYRLDVTPRAVTIRAAAPAGVFYGMQTLRQLLPVEIYRQAKRRPRRGWQIPAVAIEDTPRFAWRGLHLDVVASLPAHGVRQEVHRPARASQAQPLPLAPDRRPGLADRDQEVSEADRRRRVAAETLIGPHRTSPAESTSTARRTAASTRRTTSARSWRMPPTVS